MTRISDLAEFSRTAQIGAAHKDSVSVLIQSMNLGASHSVSRLAENLSLPWSPNSVQGALTRDFLRLSDVMSSLSAPRVPDIASVFASRWQAPGRLAESYSSAFACTVAITERLSREGIPSWDMRSAFTISEVDRRWSAHDSAFRSLGDAFRDPVRESLHWHRVVDDVMASVRTPSVAESFASAWTAKSAAWTLRSDIFQSFLETGHVFDGFDQIAAGDDAEAESDEVAPAEEHTGTGTRVEVLWLPDDVLRRLELDPHELARLSPDQMQKFAADRLSRMGWVPRITGNINTPDGGLDLIAVPKSRGPFDIVLGAQVKHHRNAQPTGVGAVREVAGWRDNGIHLGVVITNTRFTEDARFEASRGANRHFVRLKDFADLCRWIRGQYNAAAEWRDLPRSIRLTSDLEIEIPSYLFEE